MTRSPSALVLLNVKNRDRLRSQEEKHFVSYQGIMHVLCYRECESPHALGNVDVMQGLPEL